MLHFDLSTMTNTLKALRSGADSIAEQARSKRSDVSRQQEAVVGILRAAAYVRRFGARVFDEHGITAQQYNVLRILRGAGEQGLPTLDIAERMIERAPGITRLLDRLEAKGLVRRVRCPEDRRQVLCWPTPDALDLLASLDDLTDRTDRAIVANLRNQDLIELIRLLDRVRAASDPTGG